MGSNYKKHEETLIDLNARTQYFVSLAGLLMLAFLMMPTMQVVGLNTAELQIEYGVDYPDLDLEQLVNIKVFFRGLLTLFFLLYLTAVSSFPDRVQLKRFLVNLFPYAILFTMTAMNATTLAFTPWLETYFIALAIVFTLTLMPLHKIAILSLLSLATIALVIEIFPFPEIQKFTLIVHASIFTFLFSLVAVAHLFTKTRALDNEIELKESNAQLDAMNRSLKQLSSTDSLTGIFNRREFDKYSKESDKLKQRAGVILVDIDYFKEYNDTYGHIEGDVCLKKVAAILNATLQRQHDTVFRYGGEEFVVTLPGTSLSGTLRTAERLRLAVENLKIPHKGRKDTRKHVTISLGVSAADTNKDDMKSLLQAADENMYHAKQGGRNQVYPSIMDEEITKRVQNEKG